MGTRDWDLERLSNAAGALRHEVDVLVIGGGPAGAWAAISAAPSGETCQSPVPDGAVAPEVPQ